MVTTCTGSGATQQCTTTADTFNAQTSRGQTTQGTSATDQAAVSGKSAVAVKSGTQEKLGFIRPDSNGQPGVVPAAGTSTRSTSTTDEASAGVPSDAAAVIHGHIDNRSEGVVDAKRGAGDTQSLTLKHPIPNYTVSQGRVGVHEVVGGRAQFRMVDGQLSPSEQKQIQQNLDREQQEFQGK